MYDGNPGEIKRCRFTLKLDRNAVHIYYFLNYMSCFIFRAKMLHVNDIQINSVSLAKAEVYKNKGNDEYRKKRLQQRSLLLHGGN